MRRFMLVLGMGYSMIAAACGPTPSQPLAAAAAANAADAVRRLLAQGRSADDADDSHLTPLMWAARYDAVAAMTVLLDAGANPNARDGRNRWTPLLHAIHRQGVNAVELLLQRGADPNAATPHGVTPLMMAADDPRPAMVKLLLAHGADPRVEGPGGATALTQAVSGGALSDVADRPLLGGCRPETVRALFSHDPTLKLPDSFAGRHAVWWARFHGCEDVLRLLGFEQGSAAHQTIAGLGLLRQAMRERVRDEFTRRAPTPRDGR
jgi:uncharacterized protein